MLQLDEISLEERCPSFVTDVERWKASGPLGRGEIIIAPKAYIESVLTLPQWGPFSRFEIINERTIWVDGELKEDLVSLRRMLGINASIGLSLGRVRKYSYSPVSYFSLINTTTI